MFKVQFSINQKFLMYFYWTLRRFSRKKLIVTKFFLLIPLWILKLMPTYFDYTILYKKNKFTIYANEKVWNRFFSKINFYVKDKGSQNCRYYSYVHLFSYILSSFVFFQSYEIAAKIFFSKIIKTTNIQTKI